MLVKKILVDELVKYISTTSALLGGFAFAGLTAVSYDASVQEGLIIAFGVVTSLSIAINLFAMFLAGVAGFFEKAVLTTNERLFTDEIEAAWSISRFGVDAFLVSLILLAWIKIRIAAIPVTCIVLLAMIVMELVRYRIFKKLLRPTSNNAFNRIRN